MYSALRSTSPSPFAGRMTPTGLLPLHSHPQRDFHWLGLLIVGSVAFQCATAYPTPPTFQRSTPFGHALASGPRLGTFNASRMLGLVKSQKFHADVILAPVKGPIAQQPGFGQTASSQPNEELPGFAGDVQFKTVSTAKGLPKVSPPDADAAGHVITPEVVLETIDAAALLPYDEEDEREASPEVVLRPLPSPSCALHSPGPTVTPGVAPGVTPEELIELHEAPSPERIDALLIWAEPSHSQPTPESLTEPAVTPNAPVASPTMEPAFGDANGPGAESGSGPDPVISSIEGLTEGAERVGAAVGTVIGVVSILVVVVIATAAATRYRYRPFVTGTSLSDSSLDYFLSARLRPDRGAGRREEWISPWRYEASSLESFDCGA